jgi:competence protein ComEC
MTGASGSVMRACDMFSFIVVGRTFKIGTGIFNTMAASAFALLCFNPFTLPDAGFQLSYIAVVGIVLLQRSIDNWFYFADWLRTKIWGLIAVSLAAQAAAFPICLYYFHQFPNYFLLANLVAIPLSTVVLFGEIILVGVSFINHQLSVWLGIGLKHAIWAMDWCILQVDALPGSLIDGISLTVMQTIFIYLLVIFLGVGFIRKWKYSFHLAALFAFCWVASWGYYTWEHTHRNLVVVYAVPKHSAIDIIEKNKVIQLADSAVTQQQVLHNFHLKPARVGFGAMQVTDSFLIDKNIQQVFFGDKKMMLLNTYCTPTILPVIIESNIIVLSKKAKLPFEKMQAHLKGKQIIIDSSVSRWKATRWQHVCDSLQLTCWNCQTQGAFVQNF